GRDAVLSEQGAELIGGLRVGLAVVVLEDEPADRPFEGMGTRPDRSGRVEAAGIGWICGARRGSVGAVPVEVDEVIVAGTFLEMLQEATERRGAKHRHPGGQVPTRD